MQQLANHSIDYALVALFGILVAAGELVSRYRDQPIRAVLSFSAITYLFINALASVFGLALIYAFGWKFLSDTSNPAAVAWTQDLLAGFGAIALFRSSLFTVRVGDQNVGIGPSSVLMVVLRAADAGVDRFRGQGRSRVVRDTMRNVSFQLAQVALPAYCLALLQNLASEDQTALASKVKQIEDTPLGDQLKAQLLGLALMNVVGEGVLKSAVTSLGSPITAQPPQAGP